MPVKVPYAVKNAAVIRLGDAIDIELTPDSGGTLSVAVPDLPAVFTYGNDVDHAVQMAREAIVLYLETCLDERLSMPITSKRARHVLGALR